MYIIRPRVCNACARAYRRIVLIRAQYRVQDDRTGRIAKIIRAKTVRNFYDHPV